MKNSNLLIQIIFLFLFMFSFSNAKSQWFYDIEIVPENPNEKDSINLISNVGFNLGYGLNCPDVAYYTTSIVGSTIELDLFFDVSGPWTFASCYAIDTSNIGVFTPNNYTLDVTINKFGDTYTIYDIETETIEFEVINSMSILENNNNEYVKIFPNPTESLIFISSPNHLKIVSLTLLDIKGKGIKEFDPRFNELNLSEFYPGIYLLSILTNEGYVIKKVLIN